MTGADRPSLVVETHHHRASRSERCPVGHAAAQLVTLDVIGQLVTLSEREVEALAEARLGRKRLRLPAEELERDIVLDEESAVLARRSRASAELSLEGR